MILHSAALYDNYFHQQATWGRRAMSLLRTFHSSLLMKSTKKALLRFMKGQYRGRMCHLTSQVMSSPVDRLQLSWIGLHLKRNQLQPRHGLEHVVQCFWRLYVGFWPVY